MQIFIACHSEFQSTMNEWSLVNWHKKVSGAWACDFFRRTVFERESPKCAKNIKLPLTRPFHMNLCLGTRKKVFIFISHRDSSSYSHSLFSFQFLIAISNVVVNRLALCYMLAPRNLFVLAFHHSHKMRNIKNVFCQGKIIKLKIYWRRRGEEIKI